MAVDIWAALQPPLALDTSAPSEDAFRCTTRRRNVHVTKEREVLPARIRVLARRPRSSSGQQAGERVSNGLPRWLSNLSNLSNPFRECIKNTRPEIEYTCSESAKIGRVDQRGWTRSTDNRRLLWLLLSPQANRPDSLVKLINV
jgi:hypothetical protein